MPGHYSETLVWCDHTAPFIGHLSPATWSPQLPVVLASVQCRPFVERRPVPFCVCFVSLRFGFSCVLRTLYRASGASVRDLSSRSDWWTALLLTYLRHLTDWWCPTWATWDGLGHLGEPSHAVVANSRYCSHVYLVLPTLYFIRLVEWKMKGHQTHQSPIFIGW